jgi:hypothetical protein
MLPLATPDAEPRGQPRWHEALHTGMTQSC